MLWVRECEEIFKIVQWSRDLWLDLAGGSRLQAAKWWTHAKHAKSWSVMPAGALPGKKYRLAIQFPHGWNSWLSQAAIPSRPLALFWQTLFFAFHSHSSINTPYTHKILRASRENFWEKNPREKQDWLIHNLYIVTFQIPQLSPSPLLHPREVH